MSDMYSKISDELKEKIKGCQNEEELKNLLDKEHIELDPTMLSAVSGGSLRGELTCPPILHQEGKVSIMCPPILRQEADSENEVLCPGHICPGFRTA